MRRIALLLAVVFLSQPAQPVRAQAPPRLFAVGDIHGAISEFKSILKTAGLADSSGRWSGGKATLIQTGDYMDRGAGTREVLDLLMGLELQAKDAGGRAFALLGNHEVMNLIGETRDATPEIFATFADGQSEARRKAAWDQYAALGAAKTANGDPVPDVYRQTQSAWIAAHPLGYIEYREALGPRGKYGAWLRTKPIVTQVGSSIFMHAGIAPGRAPKKLDELNDRVRDEVRRLDRFVQRLVDAKLALSFFTLQEVLEVASQQIGEANAVIDAAKALGQEVDGSKVNLSLLTEAQEILKVNEWTAVDPEGALWYRGFSTVADDPKGAPFAALLERYGAQRFVTGHTPQQNRLITVRYGGRVVLIDTGMLNSVYNGQASVLEIDGTTLTAIYEDGRVLVSSR